MDKQKINLLCLEYLLPEFWSSIAPYLTGEQIIRLKLTGSSHLWRRLSAPTVVKSISLGNDFALFKRWPALLNELPSVEEVKLSNDTESWWHYLKPKIDMVPVTVRKLTIRAPQDETLSFFGSSDEMNSEKVIRLQNLEYLDLVMNWNAYISWMAHVLPNLTFLGCSSWLTSEALPITLTQLKAGSLVLTTSHDVVLPPGLRTLIGGFKNLNERRVPEKISKFELLLEEGQVQELAENLNTSRKLQDANLKIFQRTHGMLKYLSKGLTQLHVNSLPVSKWAELPPTLRILEMSSVSSEDSLVIKTNSNPFPNASYQVARYPLHLLPKSLTSLSIWFGDLSLIDIIPSAPDQPSSVCEPLFPPMLKRLALYLGTISVEAAKQLPASLTHLNIAALTTSLCEVLPRGLVELNTWNVMLTPTFVASLPPSLTTLLLSPSVATRIWIDPNSCEACLTADAPGYDVHLACVTSNDVLGDYPLPLSLTKLSLPNFEQIGEKLAPVNQKLALVDLDLAYAVSLTDPIVPLFSRHLTQLNLNRAENVTGQCFQHLPKSLRWLQLASSRLIQDPDIQHLPRNLELIKIPIAIFLTNSCIKDLPKTLTKVILSANQKITTDVFSDFPPLLRSSQVYESFSNCIFKVTYGKIEMQEQNPLHAVVQML